MFKLTNVTFTLAPMSMARIPQVQPGKEMGRKTKIYGLLGFDCYRVEDDNELYLVTLRSDAAPPTDLAGMIKNCIDKMETEKVWYTPTTLTTPRFVSAGANRELFRSLGIDYIVLLDNDNTRYLCRSEWVHESAKVIANCGSKIAKCTSMASQSVEGMSVKLADVLLSHSSAMGLAELFGAKYVPVGMHDGNELFALDGLGKTATERAEAFRSSRA